MQIRWLDPQRVVESKPDSGELISESVAEERQPAQPVAASATEESTRSALDNETREGIKRLFRLVQNKSRKEQKEMDRRKVLAFKAYKRASGQSEEEFTSGELLNKTA